jgi:hypothetical protein
VKSRKVELLKESLKREESTYQESLGREKELREELEKIQIELLM